MYTSLDQETIQWQCKLEDAYSNFVVTIMLLIFTENIPPISHFSIIWWDIW